MVLTEAFGTTPRSTSSQRQPGVGGASLLQAGPLVHAALERARELQRQRRLRVAVFIRAAREAIVPYTSGAAKGVLVQSVGNPGRL
jgi:hypothetical protein